MAEIATNVLHNVGNALNSLNVSAEMVAGSVRKSKLPYLAKLVELMHEQTTDKGAFISDETKNSQLLGYFDELAKCLSREHELEVKEIELVKKSIDHIKVIVAMQQDLARVSGPTEVLKLTDLVEDAVRMNASSLIRHNVQVIREYEDNVPAINVEKHKVLQILVNLISNAKDACSESGRNDKRLNLQVARHNGHARISVSDNGIGIVSENLTRIFAHGFTTKKAGHGFGLHSGVLAAKEMGCSLAAQSNGPGQGATFTLEIPYVKSKS